MNKHRIRRYLLFIISLTALAGFGSQILRGIIHGTASQCSVSGPCR
ncbi:hypothetical protein HZA73_09850 [candidate division TA06 bacterium]|nr:hypothetical protein [candidate division TA06 bacterium]